MPSTDHGVLERTILPTVDLLLAAFGLAVLTFPVVSVTNVALGDPLAQSTVRTVVGVVALGGSYPFVAGDWSLGRLGEFVFLVAASALVGSACLFALAAFFDVTVSTNDESAHAVVVGLIYSVAALVDGFRRRGRD